MSEKKQLSPKAKKIINIVVDVVCGVVLVFALIIAVCMIKSKNSEYANYTDFFGKAYLAVESPSMTNQIDNDGKVDYDNFSKGDLIVIKILNNSEKSSLKVGDVITFNDNTPSANKDKYVLNTHRIVAIDVNAKGVREYTTRGDYNRSVDPVKVTDERIVGKFESKIKGVGTVVSFMGTFWGFFVFVLLPTLIIVVIAAVNFAMVFIKEKKAQKAIAAQAQEEVLAEERERIRQELLAEMQGQTPPAEVAPPKDEQTAESVEEAPSEENTPSEEGAPSDEAPKSQDDEK